MFLYNLLLIISIILSAPAKAVAQGTNDIVPQVEEKAPSSKTPPNQIPASDHLNKKKQSKSKWSESELLKFFERFVPPIVGITAIAGIIVPLYLDRYYIQQHEIFLAELAKFNQGYDKNSTKINKKSEVINQKTKTDEPVDKKPEKLDIPVSPSTVSKVVEKPFIISFGQKVYPQNISSDFLLPKDIWAEIIKYCDLNTVKNIRQCCKGMRVLASKRVLLANDIVAYLYRVSNISDRDQESLENRMKLKLGAIPIGPEEPLQKPNIYRLYFDPPQNISEIGLWLDGMEQALLKFFEQKTCIEELRIQGLDRIFAFLKNYPTQLNRMVEILSKAGKINHTYLTDSIWGSPWRDYNLFFKLRKIASTSKASYLGVGPLLEGAILEPISLDDILECFETTQVKTLDLRYRNWFPSERLRWSSPDRQSLKDYLYYPPGMVSRSIKKSFQNQQSGVSILGLTLPYSFIHPFYLDKTVPISKQDIIQIAKNIQEGLTYNTKGKIERINLYQECSPFLSNDRMLLDNERMFHYQVTKTGITDKLILPKQ